MVKMIMIMTKIVLMIMVTKLTPIKILLLKKELAMITSAVIVICRKLDTKTLRGVLRSGINFVSIVWMSILFNELVKDFLVPMLQGTYISPVVVS